jgi:hypothetical protein
MNPTQIELAGVRYLVKLGMLEDRILAIKEMNIDETMAKKEFGKLFELVLWFDFKCFMELNERDILDREIQYISQKIISKKTDKNLEYLHKNLHIKLLERYPKL